MFFSDYSYGSEDVSQLWQPAGGGRNDARAGDARNSAGSLAAGGRRTSIVPLAVSAGGLASFLVPETTSPVHDRRVERKVDLLTNDNTQVILDEQGIRFALEEASKRKMFRSARSAARTSTSPGAGVATPRLETLFLPSEQAAETSAVGTAPGEAPAPAAAETMRTIEELMAGLLSPASGGKREETPGVGLTPIVQTVDATSVIAEDIGLEPRKGQTERPQDPLWYKDAIIYQVHIKSFFDSNADGVGDFPGFSQKLDYLQDLGVTCVWILPFYPSPLRDDGYDVSDYRSVHEKYGTIDDFRTFVQEAHRRGIRVVTELVINHTSDQHPWFQRARKAPRGSPERNFYVWSDTDTRWKETRIIFRDFEQSNWTWDPVAQQYFWHRFFHHQPDLNFDSPDVMREVIDVMCYWLDMGVDGLRLDAIPYLCERDETTNENLPETHEVIRVLRKVIDERYGGDRFLLAEANMWPEDTAPYFGRGDECHMAFFFPLMPRLFMSLAQEDRHPITDIIRQTPEIPNNCQWSIFLRNHDELTLEMVTEHERNYMWSTFASDPTARINLGIRRRLAPLLDNDRRKIELMNSMLMSMPGTPVIYYGDEISMGDNIWLGDRHGCRTPMQWNPDRNSGFSKSEPARLYLPVNMDSVYGYQSVNVEAQSRNPSSLLNWMKRIIKVRKDHRAFGRGSMKLLYPGNRKALAYVRETPEESILCVCNLSRAAQAVELDLSFYKNRVPVELLGSTSFPPIGDLPYLLTLASYGFFWFKLTEEAPAPMWHERIPTVLPDLHTLILRDRSTGLDICRALLSERSGLEIQASSLAKFLLQQNWFELRQPSGRPFLALADGRRRILPSRMPVTVRFSEIFPLPGMDQQYVLAFVEVPNQHQTYLLPLSVSWDPRAATVGWTMLPFTLAKVRRVDKVGALFDAVMDDEFCRNLFRKMIANVGFDVTAVNASGISTGLKMRCRCLPLASIYYELVSDEPDIKRNLNTVDLTSIIFDGNFQLTIFRLLFRGLHPSVEMGKFLTGLAGFPYGPQLLATLELVRSDGTSPSASTAPVPTDASTGDGHIDAKGEGIGGSAVVLAILQNTISNQGTGWDIFFNYLTKFLEEVKMHPDDNELRSTWNGGSSEDRHAAGLQMLETLGRSVGLMHRKTSSAMDFSPEQYAELELDPAAFAPEPVDELYVVKFESHLNARAVELERVLRVVLVSIPEESLVNRYVAAVLARLPDLRLLISRVIEFLRRISSLPGDTDRLCRVRIHGNLHLHQVVLAKTDWFIVGFAGEPRKTLEERRGRHVALKDVASLLRSLSRVCGAALLPYLSENAQLNELVSKYAREWELLAQTWFLKGYLDLMAGAPCHSLPQHPADVQALLTAYMLRRLVSEVICDAMDHPQNLETSLGGLLNLLEANQPSLSRRVSSQGGSLSGDSESDDANGPLLDPYRGGLSP